MSDETVVVLDGPTLLDLPAERILEGAKSEGLEAALVVGRCEDGSAYLASTTSDLAEVLVLLEIAKRDVMESICA